MSASGYLITPIVSILLGLALVFAPSPFGAAADFFYLRVSGRRIGLQEPWQGKRYESEKRLVRWVVAILLL